MGRKLCVKQKCCGQMCKGGNAERGRQRGRVREKERKRELGGEGRGRGEGVLHCGPKLNAAFMSNS